MLKRTIEKVDQTLGSVEGAVGETVDKTKKKIDKTIRNYKQKKDTGKKNQTKTELIPQKKEVLQQEDDASSQEEIVALNKEEQEVLLKKLEEATKLIQLQKVTEAAAQSTSSLSSSECDISPSSPLNIKAPPAYIPSPPCSPESTLSSNLPPSLAAFPPPTYSPPPFPNAEILSTPTNKIPPPPLFIPKTSSTTLLVQKKLAKTSISPKVSFEDQLLEAVQKRKLALKGNESIANQQNSTLLSAVASGTPQVPNLKPEPKEAYPKILPPSTEPLKSPQTDASLDEKTTLLSKSSSDMNILKPDSIKKEPFCLWNWCCPSEESDHEEYVINRPRSLK